MKEYIKLTKRDAVNKEYEQSRFLGTMILGFVGGYFAALGITTYVPSHSACWLEAETSRRTHRQSGTRCCTQLWWQPVSATTTSTRSRDTTKTCACTFCRSTCRRLSKTDSRITKYQNDEVYVIIRVVYHRRLFWVIGCFPAEISGNLARSFILLFFCRRAQDLIFSCFWGPNRTLSLELRWISGRL